MMLSARAVRTCLGALAQARSTFRRLSAEQTTGIDWRKADGTKDHPMWASHGVPIETEPCGKYDLVVLLALNPIRCTRASSYHTGTAGTEYGRLPWLALSVLGGHTSNAASEGCHSIAQLIMSDLQTSMGDDILQMIVRLRDGKEAAGQLKAIYPDEAKNAEVDITATSKLGDSDSELALQHRGTGSSSSAQHPKPSAVVESSSSSDPPFSGDDVESS